MADNEPSGTALITGGSSGIGYKLARQCAMDGYGLVLVGRNLRRLNSAAKNLRDDYGVQVQNVAIDLSVPGAANKLYRQLINKKISIDVLINNAGFGDLSEFKDADPGKLREMIATNVGALTELTRLVLPDMLARSGSILNVASIAGFLPGPMMAVYYASKAYVVSFSQALADELQGSGVTVTVVCPGPTSTGFAKAAQAANTVLFRRTMSSEQVAKEAYRAMQLGKPLAVVGTKSRLFVALLRWLTRGTQVKLGRRINR